MTNGPGRAAGQGRETSASGAGFDHETGARQGSSEPSAGTKHASGPLSAIGGLRSVSNNPSTNIAPRTNELTRALSVAALSTLLAIIASTTFTRSVLAATPGAPTAHVSSTPGANDASYVWHLPRGFPTPAVPADNPMSAVKVALGKRLFFEPRLSVTGKYSCSSCHDPARAYSDGRALALGVTGQSSTHSAMSLVNAAYNISYGWTRPDLQSLESQMLDPLLNEHPVELGLAGRQNIVRDLLAADPSYRAAFARAFPQDTAAPVSFDNLIKAIAAFERTLVFGDSPFDHYVFGGDHIAISAGAKRGMQLFYSPAAGCGACHSGFNFDGNWRDSQGETGKPGFANNGVGEQPMRVPTLRNIALTAPYMHDGRFATLDEVLDHYTQVAKKPTSDPRLRKLKLSPAQRADLIAFLQTLTDTEFSGR